MNIEDYFKDGKVYIWEETFAVIKAKRIHPRAFANICDKSEITVIIEERQYQAEDVLEVEPGWKIITFDMVLPFGLVGFMARVSGALAKAGISLFAISAYSTDHILIKKENLSRSIEILESMRFSVSPIEAGGPQSGAPRLARPKR
jgi:hypothetical protein